MSSQSSIVPPVDVQIAHYPPGNSTAIETLAAQAQADSFNSPWKDPVLLASAGGSVANLSSVTVANFDGEAQGVTLVAGNRVLVKDGASPDGVVGVSNKYNGIYTVGTVTGGLAALTRSPDAATSAMVVSGMTVEVNAGTNAGNVYQLSTLNPITLGTTLLTFASAGDPSTVSGISFPAAPAAGAIPVSTGPTAVIWVKYAVHVARGVVPTNVSSLAGFTGVAGGTPVDGITYIQNDILLLVGQTTKSQNGLYTVGVVAAGAAPLTRLADLPTGAIIRNGMIVEISEGTEFNGTVWKSFATTTGGAVVDTNDPVFYPRKYVRVTAAMTGSPGTVALSAEWIFNTGTSSVTPTRKVPGGTPGNLSIGVLTPGAGAGAVTITSTGNETSTIQAVIEN